MEPENKSYTVTQYMKALKQVSLKDEEIVIERAGKPLARLVSVNAPTAGLLDFRDIGKLPNNIWED